MLLQSITLIVCLGSVPFQSPPILKDGDMVALVGGTLIEREQISGYWETELTRRITGQKVRFRNLGWSGDTVYGHARAGFGSTADGYKRLIEHINVVKPTVTLFAYGANESFEGEAGAAAFQKGYDKLLKDLLNTKSKSILLAPLWHENMGAPLPDAAPHNLNILAYSKMIDEIAKANQANFYDLFQSKTSCEAMLGQSAKLTSNGIHPTELGYYLLSNDIGRAFGLNEELWQVAIDHAGGAINTKGCTVESAGKLSWKVTDKMLPRPIVPGFASLNPSPRTIAIKNLPKGTYKLLVDGKEVMMKNSEDWAKGVMISSGPDFDQVEMMRKLILEKNRQYFHRWRPQNETYLLGFRKHEQGQNARELPQFDPIVAAKEEEIYKLNKSVTRTYSLMESK